MRVSKGGLSLPLAAAAAGLIMSGLLALPAHTDAKRLSTTVVATASGFQDTQILSATATCHKGQRAAGGGFATGPPTSSASPGPPRGNPVSHLGYVQVYESVNVDQDAWRVSGQVTDPGGTSAPRTLEAYAYCRAKDKAPATQTATASGASAAILPGNLNAWNAAAQCPKGKLPTAGGFQTEPPYPILGSYTAPRLVVGQSKLEYTANAGVLKGRHTLTVFTQYPGASFTSFAYCADKGIQLKAGTRDAVGQGTLPTAFSGECGKKKSPRAGGFDQPNASPYSFDPNASRSYFDPIIGSLRVANQWWVTGLHNGAASTTLGSFAYCS